MKMKRQVCDGGENTCFLEFGLHVASKDLDVLIHLLHCMSTNQC